MSSTFGTLFKVTTFGESHCTALGGVVDGCPPGLLLSEADIQTQLDRRRPGQSALATQRAEEDRVELLSGLEQGITLGTPIGFIIRNRDQRPGDYAAMRTVPRPSHADYTYAQKYGLAAASGGGRASARETAARVCAGAIAEKMLRERAGIDIVAWVSSAGDSECAEINPETISRPQVDMHPCRCPHAESARAIEALIAQAQSEQDSLGGTVTCVCRNVPIGLGEPVFDKLEALLAQAMLSIPAAKGFEIGSGFAGARMRGSEHNDLFVKKGDRLGTSTNYSGGVQGGISNGEPVIFRVAFKPVATIGRGQATADFDGNPVTLAAKGRHDPCVLPRAVPIVESMAALVLADCFLRQLPRR
ncbi:MAG: chorismate synthase [Deltaproteobacteria bacterium]|nr:chorismate synthase [Deltaproteobacteria bacterium]